MAEELISMEDMESIFEVTDSLGIHRESVRVELTKEDPGSIQKVADGMVEIIDLEAMGYQPADSVLSYDDDDDDDDDDEDARPASGPRPRLS